MALHFRAAACVGLRSGADFGLLGGREIGGVRIEHLAVDIEKSVVFGLAEVAGARSDRSRIACGRNVAGSRRVVRTASGAGERDKRRGEDKSEVHAGRYGRRGTKRKGSENA